MKRIVIGVLIGGIVLLVVIVLAMHFFLDSAIKKGVETAGPKFIQVDVKLDRVSLSLLSGSGQVKGLVLGNPAGFKTPNAISVGSASLSLKPASLLSDKILVRSVVVTAPEITLEAGLRGSNLSQLMDNLKAATGGGSPAPASKESKPGKKLEVDEFLVTGGKVHVSFVGLAGRTATVPLPDIRLKDLGTGPEGITAAELTRQVLTAVLNGSLEAGAGAVTDLGKQAADLGKDLGKSAVDSAGKLGKGLGDLFKKKT